MKILFSRHQTTICPIGYILVLFHTILDEHEANKICELVSLIKIAINIKKRKGIHEYK